MKTSQVGIDLIKKYEGCKLTAYKCPAGKWTIGYGHTKTAKKGQKISRERAEELLKEDLKNYEKAVNKHVSAPLTQNQFDALVSFTYNCGTGALRTSTLLKNLNAKNYKGASAEFTRWNKSNGRVLKGLTQRRKAEQTLFNKKAEQKVYTVRKGDNLTKIAKANKTSVERLVKLNNLKNPDIIYPGQKLKLK